jgi:putative ABC transport system permease protein
MFKNYLKTTFRNLWRNKTYSFLNIFGLAIGITCAALIFLWVEDELQFDHYNLKINRIYQVLENQAYAGKTYTFAATPGPLGPAMKTEIPGILNSGRMTWNQNHLFGLGDKAIYEDGVYIDSSLLNIFTLPFVEGNMSTVFSQRNSLILTEKMARKFFPGMDKEHIVGKTLKVDNKEDFLITAVLKDIPENSSIKFSWAAPYEVYHETNKWLNDWGNNGIQAFVELSPNTSPSTVDRKIFGYIQTKAKDAIPKLFLNSMHDWRLRSHFEEGKRVGGRIQYVRMFTIIAWIILLIACINFMNLATARSEKRAREVGVRKVLGAERRMLVMQFIGDAMFMSLLAVLFSILLLVLLLPAFNTLVEKKLILGINQPLHILSLLSIVLVCGLVAGSYPALYLSSFNPVTVFKGLKIKGGSASAIRKGLVILQFTISIVLIISTIIIYQQIQHVKNRELGYNKDNLLQTNVQGDLVKHFAAIRQDLIGTGAIHDAALAGLGMLWMGSSTSNFSWQGKDPNKKILITTDGIDPNYIPTVGIKMIQGRNFLPVAEQDSLSLIVNESLAKLMGMENPVGQIVKYDTVPYRVVGVVKDFVYGDMYGKSDPLVFFCKPDWADYVYIKVKAQGKMEESLAKIEKVMKAENPGYPFDYRFVDEDFNNQFKTEALIGKLSRVFALLAILISCLGLFGLAAYTAERRTREIGIRKVLGASVPRITRLLSKDFLQLVFISALVAFPLSWYAMHQWLQNYAYRISISWWVFIVAGLMAMIIALLTISFQAIRAALTSPVKNLRTE